LESNIVQVSFDYHQLDWTAFVETQINSALARALESKGLRALAYVRMKAEYAGELVQVTFAVMQDVTSCNDYVKAAFSFDETECYLNPDGQMVHFLLPMAIAAYEAQTAHEFPNLVHWECAKGEFKHINR
jgi:hypothetical protein